MDGGAATAAIEVLVQNLINVSAEEISLLRDLKKDAEKLKENLAMIESFLDDAERKFIADDSVKRWLKKLEAVAFDADNVLDELNYHLLSKKMKTIRSQKIKVQSCFPSFNRGVRRRQMAHTIKEINTSFESIRKNAVELGLESKLANAPAIPDAGSEETDSRTADPIFIGRDDDVSKIVKMLTRGPSDDQVLSVLPIVGMGGLGKSTLARKVFNDEKIKTHFGKQIWVHVSKNFDAVILLKKILTNLTCEDVEVGSREVLLDKLRRALGDQTYLLVLDDVWNEDPHKWEGFINSLSGITSAKGNCILVTTRNTEVASIVKKTLDIHNLNGLSKEDCWSIIKAKAFGERDIIPSGFESIGRNIAGRCQSLPLAANVAGGVLRNKSEDEWRAIKDNWRFAVGDENISKILRLSFDHLSSPSLKKCFAYCSIFPKGEVINKQQLIELWMAEGLLQPDQTSDMETVGDKYFNLLLRNSLLQVVKRDKYGINVMHCSMHDLVHDVACSVLGFPKVNDNISDSTNQARYIGREYYGDESSPVPEEKAKYVRTLFLKGGICDAMFSNFKSLHVLTLMGEDVEELPSSIRELIHLRYLDISETIIEYLPDSIGELYHLQTVRAEPRKLPCTLKHLINLRHLRVPDYTELPPQLGKLTSLQTLPYFKVGDEEGHRIVELGSLENLKGKLKIDNLEKVAGEEEAKKAYLFQKPNIVKLVLRWDESREGEINDENVLEGLQPHPNLKILKISGFKGRRFRSWTLKMAVQDGRHWVGLNNLMEIKLENCSECEEIPMLGHLPHLKSLSLSKLMNVKSIGSSFYSIDNCSSSNNGVCKEIIIVFPALERLELSDMPNLIEWAEVEFPSEVKVFPCLEYFKIYSCKQLRSAPTQFPCLKELDICGIESGLTLGNICGVKLTSLTKLMIEGSDGLICLPNWLFRNNQNLSELEIRDCPQLRELPDDLHTLNSLERLTIAWCPSLKSIPYSSGGQSQGLTSLRWLSISDCEGLMNLPCEMVESCAPSLEKLRLRELSSLSNLPLIIDCLHKLPRLRELRIVNVSKLITYCSFQKLKVRPHRNSWDCVNSYKKAVGGILQFGSQSLCDLELAGMEDWDSLPDQLQHLTALSWFALVDFGIQELPEWFGNLTSLHTLYLHDCRKLRRLPSMEAMQRLTKFTQLIIKKCPVLKQRCIEQQNDDDDSEWLKISHIPDIIVDRDQIRCHGRTEDSYRYLDDTRHKAAED